MKKLSGIVAPLVTPFTKNDHVDLTSLRSLVNYLIDKGITCLYPCGSTGEMIYLHTDERMSIVETVVDQAAGRVPVYAHVGAANTSDTLILARHAAECGADGIAVVTPWYFPLTDSAIINYFVTVAENIPSDFPMYLYGIPQCAVNDISCETAEKIADLCPNVIGIKYSYADMTRIQDFMGIRDGNFSVLVGPEQFYTAATAIGAEGVVSGYAMAVPDWYVSLKKSLDNKDFSRSALLQRKVNSLNAILGRTHNGMGCIKAVLQDEGVIEERQMRAPMETVSDEERDSLLRELSDFYETNNPDP